MFIIYQKILENSFSFKEIFFNTFLIVSQKHKYISIVVLLVFNFKNASRLYGHPISIYRERAVDPLPLLLGGGEQTGASQTDRQTDGLLRD